MILAALIFGISATGLFFLIVHGESQSTTRRKPATPNPALADGVAPESSAFSYEILGDAPPSAPPQGSPSSTVEAESAYTVEIAALPLQAAADALLDQLKAKGIDAYYTPLSDAGRVVYRVRQGIFSKENEAAKAALILSQRADMPAKAVKLR
jgi:cell division septation protein DedD